MANFDTYKKSSVNSGGSGSGSGSSSKTSMFYNDFREGRVERVVGESSSSLQREFEDLSVSKRLVRNVSQKLRKKSHKHGVEEGDERRVSSGCLGFYVKGGGCKVGADICEEFGDGNCRRKSNVGDEMKGYQPICGNDETRVDCFANGVTERLWKRNSRKEKEFEEPPVNCDVHVVELFIPDDILEMCLMRLPMAALMTSRLVCKKWRSLTSSPRFMQMRRDGLHQSPWLFLFGVVKNGYCAGQIHALDASLDQWHKINADILKGRFLFSVATIGEDVYVVGGCSSLTNFGMVDKSSFKTHKGILVFSPLTRTWRKVASMKSPRSSSVLGVFEVNSDCSIFRSQKDKKDLRFPRSRIGGVSDVYEDPHRLSVRRQHGGAFDENDPSVVPKSKPSNFAKREKNLPKGFKRFVLIAVGGLGSWDEPLDSGEIFDPVCNKWVDIMKLPTDFGIVCSGAVCNGSFYVYSETDKLAAYDLEIGMWIGIQTSQFPPRLQEYYPKFVSCNNRLFMLSVSWCEQDVHLNGREKAVRKLWELDLTSHRWAEISRHPDAPMDWNAVFVADRGQIIGIEMFKIFGQVLDFLTVCDVSSSGSTWNRVSRKHVAHELDAASCMTKSLAVLHL